MDEKQFRQLVNEYRASGELPESLTEEQKLAVIAEKRRVDTQSAYTKAQQRLKELELQNQKLEELLRTQAAPQIPVTEELEELKHTDPEAWRKKVDALEQDARRKLQETVTLAKEEAQRAAEIEKRKVVLDTFLTEHPDVKPEDFDNAPIRLQKKLEKGDISFEEFLSEAYLFAKTPKKIDTPPEPPKTPDLNKVGGTTGAIQTPLDSVQKYTTEIY